VSRLTPASTSTTGSSRSESTDNTRSKPVNSIVVRPGTTDEAIALVRDLARGSGDAGTGARGLTARGLGRSYGDPAQNTGGTTIELTGLDRVLSVDSERDEPVVEVEAGVSLDTLMKVLLPFGLWIPVLPGTRQVTIGGAIGADVHGKNHHTQGSFGNHVRSLDLLTADGEVTRLTPDGPDAELFWATIGGMGLTGLVLRATVAVQRVETAYFSVDTDRTADLGDLMQQMTERDADYTYSVAWFDAVTTGDHMGRAVLTLGNKARLDELPPKLAAAPLRFSAPSLGTVRRCSRTAWSTVSPARCSASSGTARPPRTGSARSRTSHSSSIRSTSPRTGTGCTGRPDSCSTSSWCPSAPRTPSGTAWS